MAPLQDGGDPNSRLNDHFPIATKNPRLEMAGGMNKASFFNNFSFNLRADSVILENRVCYAGTGMKTESVMLEQAKDYRAFTHAHLQPYEAHHQPYEGI